MNNLEVGIKLNDNISGGLQKINNNLNGLKSNVDKINGISKSGGLFKNLLGANLLGGAITTGISLLTSAISGVSTTIFDAYTNSETYMTKLTGMLGGNVEKAKEHFNDLSKFAAKTPFELKELQAADSMMLAYGYTLDDVIKKMTLFGDVAAGVAEPGSTGDIKGLVAIMGQIKSKGKADTQDLYQLANRGVPVFQELSKQLGVSGEKVRKLVETGKVGEQEITKVFINLTNKGGIFYKSLENQSKTTMGRLSNISDTLFQAAGKIGNKLEPIFSKLLGFVENITSTFSISDSLSKSFDKTISAFATYFGVIEKSFNDLRDKGVFDDIGEGINNLLQATTMLLIPTVNALTRDLIYLSKPFLYITKITKDTTEFLILLGEVPASMVRHFVDDLNYFASAIADFFKPIGEFLDRFNFDFKDGRLNITKDKTYEDRITYGGPKQNNYLNPFNSFTSKIPKVVKETSKKNRIEEKSRTSTVDTITSQQPKIVNVNVLSGENASLIQKMDVTNIMDKNNNLSSAFKKQIESYLLEVLLQGTSNLAQN